MWAEVMFATNELFVQRTQRRDTYFQLFCGKITRSYLVCVCVCCGFRCWYRCNSLLFSTPHVHIACFVTSVTVVFCDIFHSDIYLNLVSCFSQQYVLPLIRHGFALHAFKSLLVSVSLVDTLCSSCLKWINRVLCTHFVCVCVCRWQCALCRANILSAYSHYVC